MTGYCGRPVLRLRDEFRKPFSICPLNRDQWPVAKIGNFSWSAKHLEYFELDDDGDLQCFSDVTCEPTNVKKLTTLWSCLAKVTFLRIGGGLRNVLAETTFVHLFNSTDRFSTLVLSLTVGSRITAVFGSKLSSRTAWTSRIRKICSLRVLRTPLTSRLEAWNCIFPRRFWGSIPISSTRCSTAISRRKLKTFTC
ncbi:hypothetical protein L596_001537 [Steinernema carpocapsae]|uniref:Uncharacterized protein n=1 Tax=Steinernema carpocapsae TaxID=34508 RepID=A0A4U8ULU7_STECR|nr:hypothetical protein L596_001537 [Steinernema carpocapsae]